MKCIVCEQAGDYRSGLRARVPVCDHHYKILKEAETKSDDYLAIIKTNMTSEAKALFLEYAETKEAIADLELKLEELKPQLIDLIPDETKIDAGTGIFTRGYRKVWRYTQSTQDLEAQVKEAKKEEEQTGVASFSHGDPFITYRKKK